MRGPRHRRAIGFSATPIVLLAAFATTLALPSGARAQLPQPTQGGAEPPAVAPAPQRGVRDSAELESFIDGVMAGQLERQHVAGATVSVVKDGKLDGLVVQDPFKMGYEGMNIVLTKLTGGEVKDFVGLGTKLLTKANAADFANDPQFRLRADGNRPVFLHAAFWSQLDVILRPGA